MNQHIASFCEAGMLICFGASWPFAVYKTWKTKSARGKSFVFLWLVLVGYFSGIASKVLGTMSWVIGLYLLNAAMVLMDLLLCYHYQGRPDESVDATPAAE